MQATAFAPAQAHVIDAIRRLIECRLKVRDLLINNINNYRQMVPGEYTEAIKQKLAALQKEWEIELPATLESITQAKKKLARYHPDAEVLPLDRWGVCGDVYGTHTTWIHEQSKTKNKKELAKVTKKAIDELNDCTDAIVSELQKILDRLTTRNPRRRSKKKIEQDNRIHELDAQGKDVKEIAGILHCSTKTVYAVLSGTR